MKALDLIKILSGNNDFEVVFRLNEPNKQPYNFTDLELEGNDVGYSDRNIVLFLEKGAEMIENIKDIEVTDEMIKAYNEYWQQFEEDELLNDQELVDLAGKVALEEAIQVSTHIQDLIAENKRLREEKEWLPIETAPRDGTLIMGYSKNEIPTRFICFWQDFHKESIAGKNYMLGIGRRGKFNDYHNSECRDSLSERNPTHWRPLQPPPKELK